MRFGQAKAKPTPGAQRPHSVVTERSLDAYVPRLETLPLHVTRQSCPCRYQTQDKRRDRVAEDRLRRSVRRLSVVGTGLKGLSAGRLTRCGAGEAVAALGTERRVHRNLG